MKKEKIDYKILNIAILMFIFFIIYQTSNFWLGTISKIIQIISPFFFAFIIAYALNPLLKFFLKKLPKGLSVFLVIILIIGVFVAMGLVVFPIVFKELPSLFDSIINFVKDISLKFNINAKDLENALSNSFNTIISDIGSIGAINIISNSLGFLSTFLIGFSAMIYFLIDMDKIRKAVKIYTKKKSKKVYKYISILDEQMKNYLTAFMKIMVISLFEYTLIFSLIGHPNALLLGFIAAISNVIPYFGGIITNTIAAITAFAISPALFIRTLIVFIVLSQVDGYVINPLVYGKSNNVKPLIVIFAIFAGGILFGMTGIVLALPLAIMLITTYRYFEGDINDKLDDIKINKNIKNSKVKTRKSQV